MSKEEKAAQKARAGKPPERVPWSRFVFFFLRVFVLFCFVLFCFVCEWWGRGGSCFFVRVVFFWGGGWGSLRID